jgi:hypothetical protein
MSKWYINKAKPLILGEGQIQEGKLIGTDSRVAIEMMSAVQKTKWHAPPCSEGAVHKRNFRFLGDYTGRLE